PEPALARLTLHEQLVHRLGLEQTGQPDELLLLRRARFGELTEVLPLEDDSIEVRERGDRLVGELLGEGIRGVLLAIRAVQKRILEPVIVLALPVEGMVALALHLTGERHQDGHVREEDTRRLTATARAHEATDRLREEQ